MTQRFSRANRLRAVHLPRNDPMPTLFTPERVTCLSLHQPYAGLVAWGAKPLETRPTRWPATRPFPHPILICASAKMDGVALARLYARIKATDPKGGLWALCHVQGQALALVDVVGCRPLVAEDEPRSWFWDAEEAAGGVVRWAYEIEQVRRVQPFPVSGLQGFGRSVPFALVEDARRSWARLHGVG